MTCRCEPVGVVEIADRLGVERNTVDQWVHRGRSGVPFPPARWRVGGSRCWEWATDIRPWAEAVGLLPVAI